MDLTLSLNHRERVFERKKNNHLRPFAFFQAEDGIRDYKVTEVQTCALPISLYRRSRPELRHAAHSFHQEPARGFHDERRGERGAERAALLHDYRAHHSGPGVL